MKSAEPYQIILRPLVTEKGVEMAGSLNRYPFEVKLSANKVEIKNAIQQLFSVRVKDVRTMMRRGKPRRVRMQRGHTRHWKKAVVTLMPGETIDFI
jgi:large subunit ribosomal protein L23